MLTAAQKKVLKYIPFDAKIASKPLVNSMNEMKKSGLAAIMPELYERLRTVVDQITVLEVGGYNEPE